MHRRMFNSIPDLHPLDANSTASSTVTTQSASRHCQLPRNANLLSSITVLTSHYGDQLQDVLTSYSNQSLLWN